MGCCVASEPRQAVLPVQDPAAAAGGGSGAASTGPPLGGDRAAADGGADQQVQQEAEEKTKREAEAKAKQEAEEKAKTEAEADAETEAEENTKKEVEAKAKKEAEEEEPVDPTQFTDATSLFDALAFKVEGHHPVRLVRMSWLLQQRGTVLKRRQELPEEAFVPAEELRNLWRRQGQGGAHHHHLILLGYARSSRPRGFPAEFGD